MPKIKEEIYLNDGPIRIVVVKHGNRIIKIKAIGESYITEVPVLYFTEFQPPKKKVIKRMAPALVKGLGDYYITDHVYSSYENALENQKEDLIKFPASESLWVEIEVEE